MALDALFEMYVPFLGIGFLLGCLPMLAGLSIHVIINIFKKV